MKYYIIIGNKKGEMVTENDSGIFAKQFQHDEIMIVERDHTHGKDFEKGSEGALYTFGRLDINFRESAQYSYTPSEKQQAWLIGRHRIARSLDFGTFGYQFVRRTDTKHISFPDKITLSFDKSFLVQSGYPSLMEPKDDTHRVDIVLTEPGMDLTNNLINCYDKECIIDPVVFKLSTFDNYGDAYIDLSKLENQREFEEKIDAFVHFMQHYPNSNIFLALDSYRRDTTRKLLKSKITEHNLTTYVEFCEPNFMASQFGRDTFNETIGEFFNEKAFKERLEASEQKFYALPFKHAKIQVDEKWNAYANSEKFISFLKHNPDITLTIEGEVNQAELVNFIKQHSIRATCVLRTDPDNLDIKKAVAANREDALNALQVEYNRDQVEADHEHPHAEHLAGETHRASLQRYASKKFNLAQAQEQNADEIQLGQNQNQNQQQIHQTRYGNNEDYVEPPKLEINNKTSIPDVDFGMQEALLKNVIGLPFREQRGIPQTESNIDILLTLMQKIISSSQASKGSYCPLSYNVEELIPGAFYVPQEKIKDVKHPNAMYQFNDQKSALFFSPPYASIAIKKDKYAFKPYARLVDTSHVTQELIDACVSSHKKEIDTICTNMDQDKKDGIIQSLTRLSQKRGQVGVNLLLKVLTSVKTKNPGIYEALIGYIQSSKDLSEFIDNPRTIHTWNALAKLKDVKKINWWNALVSIQCRNNRDFDINNLFSQFTSFWTDLDKVQKFIPIPERFPFQDFADAGITLGKMFRIMSRARNRFEQIQSFAGGNISHAYMLYDLFDISMYSSKMDAYCEVLINDLKAEDALEKSQLKKEYFSPSKLKALTEDDTVSLEMLQSYLLTFAAVNGNTSAHNNSDLSFYEALFEGLSNGLNPRGLSIAEQKKFYTMCMVFAGFGNNSTKESMVENVNFILDKNNTISPEFYDTVFGILGDKRWSDFLNRQDAQGKMLNSPAMPSLTVMTPLFDSHSNFAKIIPHAMNMILGNSQLSRAVQKIMQYNPARFDDNVFGADYLKSEEAPDDFVFQSLFVCAMGLRKKQTYYNRGDYQTFKTRLKYLDKNLLDALNKIFLDIDFGLVKQNDYEALFSDDTFSQAFLAKINAARAVDDLIFAVRDYALPLSTIQPTTEGLIERIKLLENDLTSEEEKAKYIDAYRQLVQLKLDKVVSEDIAKAFDRHFIPTIKPQLPAEKLKENFKNLETIIESTKPEDLSKILPILQQFNKDGVLPTHLLNVTAFLLKNVSAVATEQFLKGLHEQSAGIINNNLIMLDDIFKKVVNEAGCYEDLSRKKLKKSTVQHIKAALELMTVAKDISATEGMVQRSGIKAGQLLQYLFVLASKNTSDALKAEPQPLINAFIKLFDKHSVADLLDIARFDVTLLLQAKDFSSMRLRLMAKMCRNESLLNAKKSDVAKDYKKTFAADLKTLFDKTCSLDDFYSDKQLAKPSLRELVTLLDHFKNDSKKAFQHYQKDPWSKRPHTKPTVSGKNQVADKERKLQAYKQGLFDDSKQRKALDKITEPYDGVEKNIRRNLMSTLSTYINEVGFNIPAFAGSRGRNVPAIKLSDAELKEAFDKTKATIANLRSKGFDDIWHNKKYQRAVCHLLAILRESMDRHGNKNAYSTQMSAILLSLLAGNYQYAMQINTGEGKAMIATLISLALQTITNKQIVITTSNLGLASRDSAENDPFIKWFGITHASVSATSKEKRKLQANIIHTTASDFALCHGKEILIDNSNRIYINDEYDYTLSHLMPSINSQSKPNESENWWIYETIYDYVTTMSEQEAKRTQSDQVTGLITGLKDTFAKKIENLKGELAEEINKIKQKGQPHRAQLNAIEAKEREYYGLMDYFQRRITTLIKPETFDSFNRLIDSAIVAVYVLKRGSAYDVVDQIEEGKVYKRVVPTESGKPITEGDVMFMYGIHQFLIEKTIREFVAQGDKSPFLTPSELESTTYFNNYAIQSGAKSIGITGTIPNKKYAMYEALMGSGKSDVIPPHKDSQRVDAVPAKDFINIKAGSDHVCDTQDQLIQRLVQEIQAHHGPVLLYCRDKNASNEMISKLQEKLKDYHIQLVIPGITEDFTEGDRPTESGTRARYPKTISVTVGDGRGIDIKPKGNDGLLTIPTFVPENSEKVLQIYGRSGRNGMPGKTNLFFLKSELTQYGIPFPNLEEAFKVLDKVRYKEFDFAIKKIGFMQYEIQRQIVDPVKRTNMIVEMDSMYNQLLLNAVARKIKTAEKNIIDGYELSGRWEPFLMLNDADLDAIYKDFCSFVAKDKELNIDFQRIKGMHREYQQTFDSAVRLEKQAQKGMEPGVIVKILKEHAGKVLTKQGHSDKSITIDDIDIVTSDADTKQMHKHYASNDAMIKKTISIMEKYLNNHLEIHGLMTKEIFAPYKSIQAAFEKQKNFLETKQQELKQNMYLYLACKEALSAIALSGRPDAAKRKTKATIDQHLYQAKQYARMMNITNTQFELLLVDVMSAHGKPMQLNQVQGIMANYMQDVQIKLEANAVNICQKAYQSLQDDIFRASIASERPEILDPELEVLFSMLQMVTKEERDSEPVKKMMSSFFKDEEINQKIKAYNAAVKEYKRIIKEQYDCNKVLQKTAPSEQKINKYKEMENLKDVGAKNLVSYYNRYQNLAVTLSAVKEDTIREQTALLALRDAVRIKELDDLEQEKDRAEWKKRKHHLKNVEEKLDKILRSMDGKISTIPVALEEASTVANSLYSDLIAAKRVYIINLTTAMKAVDIKVDFKKDVGVIKVNEAFIKTCTDLIKNEKTHSVLERDLDWGPYLLNILRAIGNVVMLVITFGQKPNFFPLEVAKRAEVFDKLLDEESEEGLIKPTKL